MLATQDKPLEAVFISDLHLHPAEPMINARFKAFIAWAAVNTKAVYILGDFFHAWSGDDGMDDWSKSIASQLKALSEQKVSLYYLHGNRDFLLGQVFANAAGMTILSEPSVIHLENNKILLVHGDRYCTNDISHQRFRRLTRAPWFARLFLRLPLHLRKRMVDKVRQHSRENYSKTAKQMDIVLKPMLSHMAEHGVTTLVHGHTHKPGLSNHRYNGSEYKQYVLSDWDDSPQLLCYYKANGFKFDRLSV